MKNWKLSRLQISNFKAFKDISFNFDSTSLITLEGPNGFGKTTIFDALELLLTGKISRIKNLCGNVMLNTTKNYRDNVFWNEARRGNVLIKIELSDEKNEEFLSFARIAFVDDLEVPKNNKADNFSIFKLYKLYHFDDDAYTSEKLVNNDYIDKVFGRGFTESYDQINYLEQGQSTFVFSKSLTERKKFISGLMNVEDLISQADLLGKLENRLSRKSSDKQTIARIEELQSKIAFYSNSAVKTNPVVYEKISTSNQIAIWDNERFPSMEADFLASIEADLSSLKIMVENNGEIKIRYDNKRIDDFIANYDDVLKDVVTIGEHVNNFSSIESIKAKFDKLSSSIKFLSINSDVVTSKSLMKVFELTNIDVLDIIHLVEQRDVYKKEAGDKNQALIKISDARNKLTNEHAKNTDLNDHECLLCGHDWLTKDLLLVAIEQKELQLKHYLSGLGNKLLVTQKEIDLRKNRLIAVLVKELEKLNHNEPIFKALLACKERFPKIIAVKNKLADKKIAYQSGFTDAEEEIEIRKRDVIKQILSLKRVESADINVNWKKIFDSSFISIDSFMKLSLHQVENKIRYFHFKVNEEKIQSLKLMRQELVKLDLYKKSIDSLKDKISLLKQQLNSLNKSISKQTISDIELTFHVFSGRLIQNYQRGLGLFIDEGDGDRVRFCTAEKSEHDATLSMSSGQLSALSLAFFLSLHKVYAKAPFILIDDPAQSLDEINIASLSDLLRCELRDRQLMLSSHEDSIASYLRFRFKRAGLLQKTFNMQDYSKS
jgi:DNA repair protein SbcC/Rad50